MPTKAARRSCYCFLTLQTVDRMPPEPSMNPPSGNLLAQFSEPRRGLIALLGLIFALGAMIFWDFLFGAKVFAYFDIGSDTVNSHAPFSVHIANYLRSDGWPGWSFELGLGNSLFFFSDPFSVLNGAFGADAVLPLRIWIYLLKLVLAGAFFYLFLVEAGIRAALAVSVAAAYTFSGYAVIDGQWDLFATELFLHALVLWAIAKQMRSGGVLRTTLAAVVALYVTTMYFALGLFVVLVFAATLWCSRDRRAAWSQWLPIWAMLIIAVLLAAPRLIPFSVQMLDSPRIAVGQSMLDLVFAINNPRLIMAEIAGLFHKDIFGIANLHRGLFNYLESPGFFVGVLPLLVIAQLWRGDSISRRILVGGLAAVIAYFVFPAVRSAVFGFQIDYFRISTLWISILLLVMYASALEQVASKGVDWRLLVGSGIAVAALLFALRWYFGADIRLPHVWKVGGLALAGTIIFFVYSRGFLDARRLPAVLAVFVAVEALLIAYPSFHEQRRIVSAFAPGYRDGTIRALSAIRANDPGHFRIEKTYHSVSLNDAMAQDYRGVKSYMLQGSGTVRFFTDLGLSKPIPGVVNYNNWLDNFGERYGLYSLVGVRYILSPSLLTWPGFAQVGLAENIRIFRNEFALPFGVVYDRQLSRQRFLGLSTRLKDVALMNAVVVDEPVGGVPHFDPAVMERPSLDWLEDHYKGPARVLQSRGLRIEQFGNKRIDGIVDSASAGILAFSIPFAPGWTVRLDGNEVRAFRANLGMMAIEFPAGSHRVELRHSPPGLQIGFALAVLGGLLWLAMFWLMRRKEHASQSGAMAPAVG